ncbi:MAG: phospho-sugar mutase [Spiribacter sp.]|nr:phospho-sugar mutase [Spiribacter sp.]
MNETSENLTRAKAWRDADPDPETRAELDARIQRVEGAQARGEAIELEALRACFEPPLSFGTAGLRGLKGPGPAHMNHRLIQRVTAVIADVLRAEVPDAAERGVVIGYDARHGSQALAETAAQTVAGAELGVHVFDDFAATPLVAFATRELGAAAGIVLTASHNPPEYLGYKVYWSHGAQIVPPIDERIAQALGALPTAVVIPQARPDDAWHVHGEALRQRYLQAIARPPASEGAHLRVAYSAMHGVAGGLVKAALAAQDNVELHEVGAQALPDGDFPTVNFPNPEEPGALDHLTALAAEVHADIALATDPDGDRLAVAVPDQTGDWHVLMGDQTGVLLADFLLRETFSADSPAGAAAPSARAFVMNTVVSSRLLGRVAEAHGVDWEQTLTGFKWLWHRALQREAAGDRFIFAYEDAIGFCPTPRVRDKDGVAAAVAVTEMAKAAKAAGTTLHETLMALYARHGLSINRQISVQLEGEGAHERMNARLQALRDDPPTTLAGLSVTRIHDYAAAERSRPDGSDVEPIPLPATNLIQLDLAASAGTSSPANGTYHVSIRPSGTEPKLKIYLEYLGRAGSHDLDSERAAADRVLEALGNAFI